MPKIRKVPLRQCVACRQMKEKREMLRIVCNSEEGRIFIDYSSKAQGRGAYVCDNEECLKRLKRARLLDKAFERKVNEEVYDEIVEGHLGRKS